MAAPIRFPTNSGEKEAATAINAISIKTKYRLLLTGFASSGKYHSSNFASTIWSLHDYSNMPYILPDFGVTTIGLQEFYPVFPIGS